MFPIDRKSRTTMIVTTREKPSATYMWQTLERKAAFIAQVTRGDVDTRELDDIDDTGWAKLAGSDGS